MSVGAASAATDDLSFTAIAAGATTLNYGYAIDTDFSLTLTGVNNTTASSFSVAQGDVIVATVTFLNVPANVAIPSNATSTLLSLTLSQPPLNQSFDGTQVTTSSATASTSLGGSPTGIGIPYVGCGASNEICDGGLYYAPGTVTNLSFAGGTVFANSSSAAVGGINFLVPAINSPYGVPFYSSEASNPAGGDIVTTIAIGSTGVTAFGFTYGWFLGGGGDPFSVSVNNGAPFSEVMPGGPGSNTSFLGFFSSTPIGLIVIDTPMNTNDGFDIVNFGQTAAVPEPATYALMAIGLLGLGVLRFRGLTPGSGTAALSTAAR